MLTQLGPFQGPRYRNENIQNPALYVFVEGGRKGKKIKYMYFLNILHIKDNLNFRKSNLLKCLDFQNES